MFSFWMRETWLLFLYKMQLYNFCPPLTPIHHATHPLTVSSRYYPSITAAPPPLYTITTTPHSPPASMDAIVPEPQLVPPAPFHLDLNTHDVPKIVASATKIHTMLRQTFDDHHVDVLFKPNQWLFVAKAYPNNELVNFRVCLYNTKSNAYKLEFQLLDGDRISYHSLLNQIKSDLNLPTHVSFGNSPHFNASSSPSSSSTTHANVPSEENIKQMVKMIDSKYVDVKIEGLKLSHKLMCRNKISLPTFVTHSGIAAVLTALDSERSIMEVQRCGAAALNMYCEMDHANECHYLMKTSNGLKILKRLALMGPPSSTGSDSKSSGFSFFEEEEDDDEDLTHLEVQRQAASALLSLARRSSTVQFVEDIGGRQLFSSLEKSGDPRLSQIAREGLRHVSATRTHY